MGEEPRRAGGATSSIPNAERGSLMAPRPRPTRWATIQDRDLTFKLPASCVHCSWQSRSATHWQAQLHWQTTTAPRCRRARLPRPLPAVGGATADRSELAPVIHQGRLAGVWHVGPACSLLGESAWLERTTAELSASCLDPIDAHVPFLLPPFCYASDCIGFARTNLLLCGMFALPDCG